MNAIKDIIQKLKKKPDKLDGGVGEIFGVERERTNVIVEQLLDLFPGCETYSDWLRKAESQKIAKNKQEKKLIIFITGAHAGKQMQLQKTTDTILASQALFQKVPFIN